MTSYDFTRNICINGRAQIRQPTMIADEWAAFVMDTWL